MDYYADMLNSIYSNSNTRQADMGTGPNQPMMWNDPYMPDDGLSAALKEIQDALKGENEDRMFYTYLIDQAPSDEDKRIIEGIRDDEMKHYKVFGQLYYELTGRAASPEQDTDFEKPASYCDGLRRALLGEQNAVRKYRKILFAMQHRTHINILTEIITDELRHLGLYNFLFAKNGCGA